jgi:uncharacterized cupredoxin-like copper-binding protein
MLCHAAALCTKEIPMQPHRTPVSVLQRWVSVSLILLLLTACASAATPQTSDQTGATSVDVSLDSFSLTPSTTSAPAGSITFNVSNAAAADAHELVVAQTDQAADQLTVGADGTVDEASVTVIDEVEEMEPGGSGSLTADLAAGHYVLFCNVPTHYQQGMHADFTVNP